MHGSYDNLSTSNGKKDFRNKDCAELTISELLADPLTAALMRADRVDIDGFHDMLRSVAVRLQGGTPAQPMVKFTGEAKPYPALSVVGVSFVGQPDEGAARSTQAPAAAKAAKTSCGSLCSW